jgi:hypothetical protein
LIVWAYMGGGLSFNKRERCSHHNIHSSSQYLSKPD